MSGLPSGVHPVSGARAWFSPDHFELKSNSAQVALGFYAVDIGDFNASLDLDLDLNLDLDLDLDLNRVYDDQTSTRVSASSGVAGLDAGPHEQVLAGVFAAQDHVVDFFNPDSTRPSAQLMLLCTSSRISRGESASERLP